MIKRFHTERLKTRLPINCIFCGMRASGKSVTASFLLNVLKDEFDLVISFLGSPHCNPDVSNLLDQHFDIRFQFSEWKPKLIETLIAQQLEHLKVGKRRNVLILIDDCSLDSKAKDQISTLAMRARHYFISLFCISVSYTTFPKQVRRSADILFLFSLGSVSGIF